MIIKTKNLWARITWISFFAILAAGIVLRLYQHFMARPLWEDEAHLALNFIYFGYKDLTKPLENFQAAPILFLFSVETVTKFFGFSELSLRAFPFFVSLLIYPFFYFFVLDMTKSRLTAILSFLFFTLNISLIYIISEVKPYTMDISSFIGIGYLIFSRHKFVEKHRIVLLSVFGSLSLLWANTSIIVLACAGLYIIYKWQLIKRTGEDTYTTNPPGRDIYVLAVWGTVFLLNYFTFIYKHPYGEGMRGIWKWAFAPTNTPELTTFIKARIDDTLFTDLLYISSEFYFGYVLLLIFFVALYHMLTVRNAGLIFFTVIPIVLHFLLSVLEIYPFFYRFLFYLLPAIIIIMSVGIAAIARFLVAKRYPALAFIFIFISCFFILKDSVRRFPSYDRDIKVSLNVINEKYGHSKIFVTTPLTLYQFYFRTGYVKNPDYTPIAWNITPSQFYEVVKGQRSNFILLHSSYGAGDGYGAILEDLAQKDLIVNKFDYKMYGIAEIKPLPDTLQAVP